MAASDKSSKRSRLGNRVQRAVYKAAHGWKHPWYASIAKRAWNINFKGGDASKGESKLNVALQAKLLAEQKEWERVKLSFLNARPA